jgi:ribose transport system substrate-binding protein
MNVFLFNGLYLHAGFLLCILIGTPVWAVDLDFYIVAKNQSDINFQRTLEGCIAEALPHGDRCYLVGPKQQAHPREQFLAINAITQNDRLGGVAVSVIDSQLVSRALANFSVPVMTFDSPLAQRDDFNARPIHLGVNDEEIGRQLARLVLKEHPLGGSICIITDDNPNLMARVSGIRRQLAQSDKLERLTGQNGWSEPTRCPWFSGDSADRVAQQMKLTIEVIQPDVIVSVGHWPVYFLEVYNSLEQRHLTLLKNRSLSLYAAIGQSLPHYQQMIDIGFARAYVPIDFFEQGKLIYQILKTEKAKTNLEDLDGVFILGKHE